MTTMTKSTTTMGVMAWVGKGQVNSEMGYEGVVGGIELELD